MKSQAGVALSVVVGIVFTTAGLFNKKGDAGVPDGTVYSTNLYNEPNIVEDIKIRRLGWAGHIVRMEEERIPKKVLNGNFYTTNQ